MLRTLTDLVTQAAGGGFRAALFWLIFIIGCAMHWLAPRLPMADLPQHAGQIAGLADMMRGDFLWGDIAQLNWLTPYLLAYSLAALVTLLLPVTVSIALILTAAYASSVLLCLYLRRIWQRAPQLDLLFLPGFFGLAWHLGSFSFLVAFPLALLFIALCARQARNPAPSRLLTLTLCGLLLLTAHILAFGFAALIGGLILLLAPLPLKTRLMQLWPFLIFFMLLLAYPLLVQNNVQAASTLSMGDPSLRLLNFFHLPLDGDYVRPLTPLFYLLWLLPWICGCGRPSGLRGPAIPFLSLCGLWLLMPTVLFGTNQIYQRFAVFSLPFFAFLFAPPPPEPRHLAPERIILAFVLVASCLFYQAHHVQRFAQEDQVFADVLAELTPERRLLMHIADSSSPAFGNRWLYFGWPAWYQAEQRGWVDFNFAFFFPQMVSLRDRNSYSAHYTFAISRNASFDWSLLQGQRYDFFLVRGRDQGAHDFIKTLITNSDCTIERQFVTAEWQLYKKISCQPIAREAPGAR